MKKLRTAIIGQGRSGRDIHGAYYRSDRNDIIELVAVVELDPERRERALKEYPGCEVYEDYRDLFGRTDLDLVVNATYSDTHYSISKDLLEHGFNVLVEKPFARNYYEGCELIKTAKKHGVVINCFQQTFMAPFYRQAKEVIASGKLGEIKQININFGGFGRRWDWQTLQMKMGGGIYNTGPHPIGIALGFLDFDPKSRVAFSSLDNVLSSGDADDIAKIILTAPGKPVIDVEVNSNDAYVDCALKILGSRGSYKSTTGCGSWDGIDYKMKYIVDGENPEQPVIVESLKNEEGLPMYCSEKLITHEEEGAIHGNAFDVGVNDFYHMLYDTITTGAELIVKPEHAAMVVNVIEAVHAQNPMPVKF